MKSLLCLLALAGAAPLAAQSGVDTSGAGVLIEQALNRSEVMQNLQHLGDVLGPRLSGSPAMRRANDWTAERFRAYGLTATLEPYAFGVPWERGSASLRLTVPFSRAVDAHSWAWTEGTGGKTSFTVESDLQPTTMFFWRARAIQGSATGIFQMLV